MSQKVICKILYLILVLTSFCVASEKIQELPKVDCLPTVQSVEIESLDEKEQKKSSYRKLKKNHKQINSFNNNQMQMQIWIKKLFNKQHKQIKILEKKVLELQTIINENHKQMEVSVEKLANQQHEKKENIESEISKNPCSLERPLPDGIHVKYRDIYEKFLSAKLIYKPNINNNEGMIEFKFLDLTNSLEGEFDLSRCGDISKYLSINTGYRRQERSKSHNNLVEYWITPTFMIERDLQTQTSYMKDVWDKIKDSPITLIITFSSWPIHDYWYMGINPYTICPINLLKYSCASGVLFRVIDIRPIPIDMQQDQPYILFQF